MNDVGVTATAGAVESGLNPRTTRVRRLVVDAAIELLLERGPGAVTALRVAERTGVARTTIYRQWPERGGLLLATIGALTAPHSPAESLGDVRADVTRDLHNLRHRLIVRDVRLVFGALAARSAADEAFAAAQRHFVEQLAAPLVANLQAAVDRGQLPTGIDCSDEADFLVGPILHRWLVLHADVSEAFVDGVVERWASGRLRDET